MSKEEEVACIHQNSIEFWKKNKEDCRRENAMARKNRLIKIKERIYKGKGLRV